MNTPDYTPKNGDFVAYLEELERAQAQAHATAPMGNATKGAPTAGRPFSSPITPAGVTATQAVTVPGAPVADPLDLVRSLPLGLVIVGVALVLAGAAFKGGVILVLIGLLMLASAIRQAVKSVLASARSASATPAQQIATILKAAGQQKGSAKK